MSDEYSHTKNLIDIRKERLQILEEREAISGLNTPPEITMEIRQIRKEIDRLSEQLQREVIQSTILLEIPTPEQYSGLILLIGPGRIHQNSMHQSALDAIKYHTPKLKHCWLIGSGGDDRGSLPIANEFGGICERQGITSHVWQVTNAFIIQETYDVVQRIYAYDIPAVNLVETNVIADITGATKPMSFGMMLACGTSRPMQYMVRQKEKDLSVPIMLRYSLD